MREVLKTAAIIGGLGVSLAGATAQAGGCGNSQAGPNCQPESVMHYGGAPSMDPMHVYSSNPMGHLRSVQYLGTPSVNIMRVHGMGPTAGLSDAPSGFTDGCMAESTQYCRKHMGAPAPVAMPQPYIAPPAPVMAQPRERVVYVGGGYDPSKFIPRTYGSTAMTPGIAHIPTSIVDRSHANAHAVLSSGMTRPQPVVSGGMVPHPSMMGGSASSRVVAHGSIAPVGRPMSHSMPQGMSVIGNVNHTVQMAPQGPVYSGSMGGDGSYWEKVSGPTMLGGMQATQVICKRQAERVNVQRPVVGVPTPVPTACNTQAPVPMHGPMMMRQSYSRYGH